MVSERTWLAREQQKKAAEAYWVNNKAEATTAAPEPAPTTKGESPNSSGEKNSSLSTTQWLSHCHRLDRKKGSKREFHF